MMRHAVLVDSGVLYALVARSDQHHVRAQEEQQHVTAEQCQLVVPYPALTETYGLISQRAPLTAAQHWLRSVTGSATLHNPLDEDWLHAVQLVLRYPDQLISLVDAMPAVVSE
jgi:predicted nucleic acid-binding protein